MAAMAAATNEERIAALDEALVTLSERWVDAQAMFRGGDVRTRLREEVARRLVGLGFDLLADPVISRHAWQAAQRHVGTDYCEDFIGRWTTRLERGTF